MERPGIFVKSVVAGSAASMDGRLGPGDQLLEVEGVSLCGRSQVRDIMYHEGRGYGVNKTYHITGKTGIYNGFQCTKLLIPEMFVDVVIVVVDDEVGVTVVV